MSTQRYTNTPQTIETIMTWVKSGEIAIPEIQRPFVWDATKVRNLLDSLYLGYPVGYLIIWQNPAVKLKDGTKSTGKKILIDGQQRVLALMASILGIELITKAYNRVKICISFNPIEEKFEVANPAIQNDPKWIYDVSELFSPHASLIQILKKYMQSNPDLDENIISGVLEKLRKLYYNNVGVITLDSDLDIDTVTEIFIRVNSAGSPLSQADFAMSKIAVNEIYGGNILRKAIEYFCHLAVRPEFNETLRTNDPKFVQTEFYQKMQWLKNENDEIYDPKYTDVLRVSFATQFKRGKLQDLVALISGRNFQTKDYEESIIESSFANLKQGFVDFINEFNFKSFVLIIRSAGFIDSSLLGAQNSLNFAYIAYMLLKAEACHKPHKIEQLVRRWFVFTLLTGRYSGSTESVFEADLKLIGEHGFERFSSDNIRARLSDDYWESVLPMEMDKSLITSPYFKVFRAAQVKMMDKGFLSRDLTAHELIKVRSDVHHIYPRALLKDLGKNRSQYNQIANFAIMQTEINIAIGKKAPNDYLKRAFEQCKGGTQLYGNILDLDEMNRNLMMNCIPAEIADNPADYYEEFLGIRRKLMAEKIKAYFFSL